MDFHFLQFILTLSFTTGMSYPCSDEKTLCLQRLLGVTTAVTSTFVVYDESYDLSTSELKIVLNMRHPSLVYEYRKFYSFLGHHMKSVLQNVPLADYRKHLSFTLVCGTTCIEDLINYADSLDNSIGLRSLLRHFSTWLIISQDPPPYLDTRLDNVVVITVSKGHPENATHMQYSKPKKLHANAEKEQEGLNLQVRKVYSLLWMPQGREWSSVYPCHQPNDALYSALFPNTQRGLNGRQLQLATLEWRPYVVRHVKNGTVTYTGAGVDVFETLKSKFNFSYVIVEPDDMRWGQELDNGSWTGVIGMIQRGEAETSPCIYGVTLRRKRAMDFTSPILTAEYFALYIRHPDDMKTYMYFLSCFSWEVYICGSVALLWTACLLACILRQKGDVLCALAHPEKEEYLLNYFEIGICIPLRQAILTRNERSSVRCLLGTWCVFCMMITAVYTGNLIAFATEDKYKAPFTTLQELAQQNEYLVGVLEGDYAENIMMTTDDPLLKSIYKKVVRFANSGNYNSSTDNVVPDPLQRVLNEKYVLISSWPFKSIILSLSCDVEELKERLFPAHSAFAFQRNSPLMKLFDDQVILMRDLGIMKKFEMEWTRSAKRCESSTQTPTFKLHNLTTVAVACSVGILLSTVALLVERRMIKK